MAANTQIVSNERLSNLGAALEKYRPSIEAVLPKHMTGERIIRIVFAAASRNPLLLECTPLSIASAVITSSQLGLEPVGPLGHAYLVPYYNNKTGNQEAQLIIGYQGMVELVNRSAKVKSIRARAVHKKDDFKISYGLREDIQHTPVFDDPGEFIGAYAVAEFGDEQMPKFEFMAKPAIDAIKDRAKAKSGPWVTDYEQMALKTVLKRLCKTLPKSIELASAIEIDNAVERGENFMDTIDADMASALKGTMPEGEPVPVPAKVSKSEQMAAKLGNATQENAAPINPDMLALDDTPVAPQDNYQPATNGNGAAIEVEKLRDELMTGLRINLTEQEAEAWCRQHYRKEFIKLTKDELKAGIALLKAEMAERDR